MKFETKSLLQAKTNLSKKLSLVEFLQEELAISQDTIAIALHHQEEIPSHLPMILWQYGLITLKQLEQIFDWLETV